MILITSDDDEAGLLLQLGAAPRELYVQLVRTQLSKVSLVAEWLLARAIVVGLLLRGAELILERLVLGFSWHNVLFFDYEMADLSKGEAYPPQLVKRVDMGARLTLSEVTAQPQPPLAQPPVATVQAGDQMPQAAPPGVGKHASQLLQNLRSVQHHLVSQIKLRHSLYYQSDAVLERIVDELMREHAAEASREGRATRRAS